MHSLKTVHRKFNKPRYNMEFTTRFEEATNNFKSRASHELYMTHVNLLVKFEENVQLGHVCDMEKSQLCLLLFSWMYMNFIGIRSMIVDLPRSIIGGYKRSPRGQTPLCQSIISISYLSIIQPKSLISHRWEISAKNEIFDLDSSQVHSRYGSLWWLTCLCLKTFDSDEVCLSILGV